MSWSVSAIGTPEKIAEYLESYSGDLSGQSKIEYDDAKPHLIGVITQNFQSESYQKRYGIVDSPIVKLTASGSGSASGGQQDYRSCVVQVETFYSKLLV